MNENRVGINKQNAALSTGPRTAAGKARSRLNALKHGAYATVCLEDEDRARYKALLLDLLSEYQPLGFEERLLVEEIAKTLWRKNRFESAEALVISSYRYATIEGVEIKGDVGLALQQDAASYGVVWRCLAAEDILDRRLWRLFSRLRKLQKRRGIVLQKGLVDSGKPVIEMGARALGSCIDTSPTVDRELMLTRGSPDNDSLGVSVSR